MNCCIVIVAALAALVAVALRRSPLSDATSVDLSANVAALHDGAVTTQPLQLERVTCGGHELRGCESFVELAAFRDSIFTGTADGRLLQLPRDAALLRSCRHVTTVLRVGAALADKESGQTFDYDARCGQPEYEAVCGRLLGLRAHPLRNDSLIGVDAAYGLLVVHVPTASVQVIANHDPAVANDSFLFANDLVVVGHSVYFTVSSGRFDRPRVVLEVLEASCTGRLLRLDLATNEVEGLLSGLCFPNGVEQRDDASLIVAELTRGRVLRYELATRAVSTLAVVGGTVDNMRRSRAHPTEFWLAASARYHGVFFPALYRLPLLRQFFVGLLALCSATPEQLVLSFVPPPLGLIERRSLLDGAVTARFFGDASAAHFSEIFELDASTALVGSFRNEYIGLLRLL